MGAWGITMRQSDYGLDLLGTIVDTQLKQVDFADFNVAEALKVIKADIMEEIRLANVIPEGKKFLAYVGIGKGKDRKRIKARGVTEDEATRKLEQKLIDMGFVAPPANTPKLVMTVNKFTSIPDFVKEYRVNGVVEDVENGIITSRAGENYIYMLDHFERYFRFVTVGDITVNVLNQFF